LFQKASIQAGYGIMAWHPCSHIVELGLIEPRAEKQLGCFAAGITLLVLKASYLHLKLTMLLKVPLMRHCLL